MKRLMILAAVTALLAVIGFFTGCTNTTVAVFSSRFVVQASGTNAARQSIEGGAILASNTTTATAPMVP